MNVVYSPVIIMLKAVSVVMNFFFNTRLGRDFIAQSKKERQLQEATAITTTTSATATIGSINEFKNPDDDDGAEEFCKLYGNVSLTAPVEEVVGQLRRHSTLEILLVVVYLCIVLRIHLYITVEGSEFGLGWWEAFAYFIILTGGSAEDFQGSWRLSVTLFRQFLPAVLTMVCRTILFLFAKVYDAGK